MERLLRHLEDLELKWNALRPPQLVDLPIYPGAKLVRSTPRHMMTGEFARNAVGATSQNCYRKMILDFLVQNGGCAEAYEVDSHIEAEREGKFTEADLETLPSGGSIRWKNYVHWERKKLVLEELLYDGDPRGVWSLTEQGRKYYEEHVGSIL
ncbi:MAG: winged helix-turn-helix domain-containing protein [Candidatus Sumerlaeaceae bacterium]